MADTATGTQTSHGKPAARSGSTSPAAESTTTARSPIATAWTTAATRSGGGNRPGKAPPIAYAPQGAPRARASWNTTTPPATTAKMRAAVVVTLTNASWQTTLCELLSPHERRGTRRPGSRPLVPGVERRGVVGTEREAGSPPVRVAGYEAVVVHGQVGLERPARVAIRELVDTGVRLRRLDHGELGEPDPRGLDRLRRPDRQAEASDRQRVRGRAATQIDIGASLEAPRGRAVDGPAALGVALEGHRPRLEPAQVADVDGGRHAGAIGQDAVFDPDRQA